MTNAHLEHLSESEKRRLIAVETDVRQAMKEAFELCDKKTVQNGRKPHFLNKNNRFKTLFAVILTSLLAGCGFRYEIYSYSPDEFERNDRQVYRDTASQRYERAPK